MSWISGKIDARGGTVPFDTFMELALYDSEHGYYAMDRPRLGRRGDFLTAPSASPWYPRVAARLARQISKIQGRLRLVDVAAGDGALLSGVRDALGSSCPEVLGEVVAVDRSPAMRARLQKLMGELPGRIESDISAVEVSSTPTLLHASELYDAFPVARAVGRSPGVRELWVGLGEQGLVWQERPARPEVAAYFARHGVELADGQVAEANLQAAAVHRQVLRAATGAGLCLVLDYGYEARRLYDPRGRRGGSLATYRGHRVGRDPLEGPGKADLTAHVNWDDLRVAAEAEGWEEVGLWPLAEFLVRAGLADELAARGLGMEAELDAATVTARQEVKRLLDPDGMGSDLKMLVQARGEMVDTVRSILALDL
jgi:SAM-dependent MidA family methyltransferase